MTKTEKAIVRTAMRLMRFCDDPSVPYITIQLNSLLRACHAHAKAMKGKK